ncbi:multitransmembrane protein [Loigolactobacillus bifermentans DSM 20003]|jgi:uncharacterized membrane protein|uniref:Multitransmembrane protein n=2 Tax=Loigolactobacillus bifermentans TaxID=1607 RepID=A0A0R1H965_9LACO|nr:multitransmembrane protein [Loigolactobacillus bifermentans DSM 20003]
MINFGLNLKNEMIIMKQWWQRWWLTLVVIIGGGFVVFGVAHNARLYHTPVAVVTQVKQLQTTKEKDQFNNQDRATTQRVTLRLLNGKRQGKTLHATNTYSQSNAYDQPYHTGQQVLLNLHGKSAAIQGLKRDTSIVLLLWLALSLLVLTMHWTGLIAFLSVVMNLVLFLLAIKLDLLWHSNHFLVIFSVLTVIFATLTLWLVLGWGRQMGITLATTLSGTLVAILISLLVLQLTNHRGLYFESVQYVTQVAPRPLFIAETILGSLGAVMDESTDIVATLFQLKTEQPNITTGQLFKSGRKVGQAIMGPLINVLFLIFVADTFPLAVLFLRNGNSWHYTFSMNMSLGVTQSLISGIGIVLAVPLASWLTSLWIRPRQKEGAA